jgi:methylenetetrahydrofolate dehydrogenase (NADP+)/methenyltetrahydrofolate cyclohydrolase
LWRTEAKLVLLLEGKKPSAPLKTELARRAKALGDLGRPATLAAVLVGDDPASHLYLKRKARLGASLGIRVEGQILPTSTSEDELFALLRRLSTRADVHGILLEQPLPPHIRKGIVLPAIDPRKDVDGATGRANGLLTGDKAGLAPATPLAVMQLLDFYKIPLEGREVVIVGHSPVVGKPLALMMLARDATVTVCHKATLDLAAHTRRADVVVVAAGVPGLITGEMVKPGATVVDVGINLVDGQTVGDVDWETVAPVAGALTPVPGGVGPLTTLLILANTLRSAERAPFQERAKVE